jgi:hypothetical protein
MNEIARWTNKAKESIVLFDDLTYEVLLESGIRKANLAHWYKTPRRAINHIQNDIDAGYYPRSLVQVEA